MPTKAAGPEPQSADDARTHQARPLGNVAGNIVDQINQANRQDVKDSYDALIALVAGDVEAVQRILKEIAERNQDFWEVGILTRAAEYTAADRVIMAHNSKKNAATSQLRPLNQK